MKNYLISVVTVALCSSLAGYMAVERDGGGIGKDLRMLGAICIILSIILPLSPVLSDIGDISDKLESMLEILRFGNAEMSESEASEEYEKIFNSQLIKSSVNEVQNSLKDLISQKFSIEKEDCHVEIVLGDGEDGEIYTENVIITLKGQAVWKDPYAIEEYITSLIKCNCIVRSSN